MGKKKKQPSDRDFVHVPPDQVREFLENSSEKKSDNSGKKRLGSVRGAKKTPNSAAKEVQRLSAKLAQERAEAKFAADQAYKLVSSFNEQIEQVYQALAFQGEEPSVELANAFLDRYHDAELSNEERSIIRQTIQYVTQKFDYQLYYEESSEDWVPCLVSKSPRTSRSGERFRFVESGTKRHLVSPLMLPAEKLAFE